MISISPAAARLHPHLAAIAGGASPGRDVRVVAGGETGGDIVVAAGSEVRRCATTGRLHLAFGAEDAAFAAALIAAFAGADEVPAGGDPASAALLDLARRVAARDVTVLIAGPTGTGKEVLARYVHDRSPRRDGPFVAVNCAAIPETMLEATLFGHERGAFTGAGTSSPGLFRAATAGTLLLDELSELPLALQAKLLRTLQEREVLPVGAVAPVPIDVRVIAAVNRDLAGEVAAGRFRADLFYRVAVFPLTTIPLVERPADVVPIAAALWLRQGIAAWPTPAALTRLVAHDWPGNVRELGNVVARAAVYADGARITAADIRFDPSATRMPAAASLGSGVRDHEAAMIRTALAECSGRRRDTAARLGISERTLRYKLAAIGGAPAAAVLQ